MKNKISRREFLQFSGVAVAATTLAACGGTNLPAPAAPAATPEPTSPSAQQALQLLKDGNARYVAAKMVRPNQSTDRRASLAAGQKPFAIIFSCVDSRVPPELAFDRGLGDLFVIRTAGHAIDRAALGSIQYGVEHLHIPLIVVMGHEKCGAVSATIETVEANAHAPDAIDSLVQAIKPAIEKAKNQSGDRLDNTVKANTVLTVEALKANAILGEEVKKGKLMIVGTRYDLDTGMVEMVA
jgi:carbonic anhydrase